MLFATNETKSALKQVMILALLAIFLWGSTTVLAATSAPQNDHLIHTVSAGDTLIKICSKYRSQTNHYTLSDLMNGIRRDNDLHSNLLQIGQKLIIPIMPAENYPVVSDQVSGGAELRGIYLTGPACGVSSVWRRVDNFIAAGGNAVVFDAKDIDGGLSYGSAHPLASWGKGRPSPVISSLPEMMKRFDDRGLYVIARLALFLDGELGRQRPDLALQDAQGQPWTERGCFWINAAHPDVIDYNLTLAKELAAAGVDEIQFDYVRFPTNGWRQNWDAEVEEDPQVTADHRIDVVSKFLTAARDSLEGSSVRISADLYGIMAWGRTEDLALTGQHVPTIASLVDVICPMIYPSHFNPGFEGRRRPGDDPEYFIGEGTRRFAEMAAGQAEIRPWLQAFPYKVSNYDGRYIESQVISAREFGGSGWCLWNPACRYGIALGVIPGLLNEPVALALNEGSAVKAAVREDLPSEIAAGEETGAVLGGAPAHLLGALVPPRDAEKPEASPDQDSSR